MAKHPTPLDTLKERKREVDIYVKRLDNNKCKGDFVDMYKQIQKDFENAIVREENAKLKNSALPIFDVSHLLAFAEFVNTKENPLKYEPKDMVKLFIKANCG